MRSVQDQTRLNGILLQETDKATMDVEAQEDGIMAKIIVSKPRNKMELSYNSYRIGRRWKQSRQGWNCYRRHR